MCGKDFIFADTFHKCGYYSSKLSHELNPEISVL